MQRRPLARFAIRWLVTSLGLWVAGGLLGSNLNFNRHFWTIPVAGLILAVMNVVIKPLVVILSLPAVLFTLGLFMLVINGLMIYLASKLYSPLHVANFWYAVLAGMIVGLVNYLVTTILVSNQQTKANDKS